MKKAAELSESLEDYLEVILDLEREKKVARAKDIAQRLGIQPGSVTGGLKSLEEKHLINYEPYSFITLTEEGEKLAVAISRRHGALKEFLIRVLQLDEITAEATACRMEHAIDETSMGRLVSFVEYLFQCPRGGDSFIQGFAEYIQRGVLDSDKCSTCLDACVAQHRDELPQ